MRRIRHEQRTWPPWTVATAVLVTMAVLLPLCVGRTSTAVGMSLPENPLFVHIIPHSHTDAGWVRSFDAYYENQVQYILDSVTDVFLEYQHCGEEQCPPATRPSRPRFVWADTAYLARWWRTNSTSERREAFSRAVRSGDIEFVGGGWVMHDEAVTTYAAIIDQMTLGHQWLLKTFGEGYERNDTSSSSQVVPRFAWQIDPFGASAAVNTLFALMGFEAVVHARMNEYMKQRLMAGQGLQFLWRGLPEQYGRSADLLTHVLAHGYGTPNMNWEGSFPKFSRGDSRLVGASAATVDAAVTQFISYLVEYVGYYPHSARRIMLPWGGDFAFQHASVMFENVNVLIHAVNALPATDPRLFGLGGRIHASLSTVAEYFDDLKSSDVKSYVSGYGATSSNNAAVHFPLFVMSDMLPNCDQYWRSGATRWWTGFYSAHGLLKLRSRLQDARLRVAEVIFSLASAAWKGGRRSRGGDIFDTMMRDIEAAREARALMQHHDAITSTSPISTISDYMRRMAWAMNVSEQVLEKSSSILIAHSSGVMSSTVDYSNLLRVQRKDEIILQGARVLVIANPLAWPSVEVVSFLVQNAPSVIVQDDGGKALHCEVVQEASVVGAPRMWRLYFVAHVPAVGLSTYFLRYAHDGSASVSTHVLERVRLDEDVNVSNRTVYLANGRVGFTGGLLSMFKDVKSGRTTPIRQEILAYSNVNAPDPEGAYTFSPNGAGAQPYSGIDHAARSSLRSAWLARGAIVEQVTQLFVDDVSQVIRVLRAGCCSVDSDEATLIEVSTSVGPLKEPQDVVLRYVTNLENGNGTFFADENGMDLVRRAPIADDVHKGEVAGHVAPMVSRAVIRDDIMQFAVVTDRSLGVSSPVPSSLEFMLHRETAHDDDLGMGERLIDRTRVTVTHQLWYEAASKGENDGVLHKRALRMNNRLVPMVTADPWTKTEWHAAGFASSVVPMNSRDETFPEKVHLLSFEVVNDGSDRSAGGGSENLGLTVRVLHMDAAVSDSAVGDVHIGSLFDDGSLMSRSGCVLVSSEERMLSDVLSIDQFAERCHDWRASGELIDVLGRNWTMTARDSIAWDTSQGASKCDMASNRSMYDDAEWSSPWRPRLHPLQIRSFRMTFRCGRAAHHDTAASSQLLGWKSFVPVVGVGLVCISVAVFVCKVVTSRRRHGHDHVHWWCLKQSSTRPYELVGSG